jgi:hypothetical protein
LTQLKSCETRLQKINQVSRIMSSEEKRTFDSFLTWREWVEANIKIREINNEMERLDSLEKFIENKERELLRKIIAHSTPEIADRLFNEDEKEEKGI